MTLVLANRDPEPDETQVPIATDVSVDIMDDSDVGVDTANTKIFIDSVLAYDGGTFQTGFTGPNSADSNPDVDTLRVVIDPNGNFDSLKVIPVQVQSQDVGAINTIDETYSFTTEDLIAPAVVSVTAEDLFTVRVAFNETVLASDPTVFGDALNPIHYTFVRQSAPAADIVASSITRIFDDTIDITLDIEMTPGATYDLTVVGVEDLFGNSIPNDTVEFIGFQPFVPPGRRFDLFTMIPAINRREDATGDLANFVGTIQETLNLLLFQVDTWLDIIDVDRAPEDFVDAILLDLGNPFSFDLDEIDKRRLITLLVEIYRQKGTCVGILNAIRFFLALELTCDEFNNDEGTWILGIDDLENPDDTLAIILAPSTVFDIKSFALVSTIALTAEQRQKVTEIAEYMKPLYTHFRGIDEPIPPPAPFDHLELGESELGIEWDLH